MKLVDSYIIHIYRRDSGGEGKIIGTVEGVEKGEKKSFNSAEELWRILKGEELRDHEEKEG